MVEPIDNSSENQIEKFKIKKVLQNLAEAKGNGTSMISLIIPGKDQLSQINKLLTDEYGKASCIKSRVNRQSVMEDIVSAKERLKLYKCAPNNGLALFCGNVYDEDGRSVKKYTIDFEPFKPLSQFLYKCDNVFHTEPLQALLEEEDKFGFVVMDGNGVLYGLLQGSSRTILQKVIVDLPKKHGRGGQSSVRFARLREEKRHNYIRKAAELTVTHFITDDKVNVAGIILAGSADFKVKLKESDMFDPRLLSKVIKVVDTSYGFENGFNQAITLAEDALKNVKYVREKNLISKFFENIATDTGMVCFGTDDTMKALELTAAETLIVYENLPYYRVVFKNPTSEETKVLFVKTQEAADNLKYKDKSDLEFEKVSSGLLNEWLLDNYKKFGSKIELISDRSQEGFQFVKGFTWIGAFLRYSNKFLEIVTDSSKQEETKEENDDFI